MRPRPPPPARRKISDGWGPGDITAEQRTRAWNFFQESKSELEVRDLCHLTAQQYDWLVNVGDDKRPSFMALYAEQLALIKTGALEMALSIRGRGLSVVKAQLDNALLAEEAKTRILLRHGQLDADGKLPVFLSRDERETLKVLDQVGTKIAQVGSAFRQIYGGELRVRLADEEEKGKAQGHGVSQEFMAALSAWTPEQVKEYVKSGEEPKRAALVPSGRVIEAEIVPDIKEVPMDPRDAKAREETIEQNALKEEERQDYAAKHPDTQKKRDRKPPAKVGRPKKAAAKTSGT